MQRIREQQFEPERETIMSKLLKHRWGFGLSAAAAAAIVLCVVLISPRAQARAVEIMTKGAQAVAKLTTIHLRGQLRTYPGDNFSAINPDGEFHPVELWKELEPELKWRIEKSQRVVVMDGQSTVMLIKAGSPIGVKHPQRTTSAYDTEWLHRIANLSKTITNEVQNALARGWKLSVADEPGAEGRLKSVVTVMAKSGVPDNDYGKNTFIENADTRRVYRFDAESELLEAVQVYVVRPAGETKIFDLSQIEYNQPIDPKVWTLELPAEVNWVQEPQKLSDNEKYSAMTAEQAARAFLEACAREDWDEAGKFYSPITPSLKQAYGGLKIVSLGESFTSKTYPGRFVPYEIKFRTQDVNVRLSNSNPGNRYVVMGMYDNQMKLVQEYKWTNLPAVLPDNDACVRMSPAEVVKACANALEKFDWLELKKLCPDNDVDNIKRQFDEAAKAGLDVKKFIPEVEVGAAFWSEKEAAWFVKCRTTNGKKWNLAVRKDNPTGRWQMDGGF
jgi:hypothetical protein